MADASHRMAKPAPQSVALYLPPFSHTGARTLRTHGLMGASLSRSFVDVFHAVPKPKPIF